VIMAMGLVPGLPKLPFFLVGGALVVIGRTVKRHAATREREQALAAAATEEARPVSNADAAFDALVVDPLELAIGFGLVPMADKSRGGGLLARVGVIRRQIAGEFGIVIAPVRIYDDVSLESHEYVIKVRGNEAARWRVIAGHRLAMNTGDAMPGLAGIPT